MNIRGLITYVGTEYRGFQKTKLGPSIEESLEQALFTILQKKTTIQGASRTDAGVHARGQVINFFLDHSRPLDKFQNSLNAVLPPSIRVLFLEKAMPHFHPSLDSIKKTYSYSICNREEMLPLLRRTSWHYPYKKIDLSLIKETIPFFLGSKNYSSFTSKTYENPICSLEKITIKHPDTSLIKIFITGDRFLYKMVRILIGTLVEIGTKKILLSDVKNLFYEKNRKKAGVTAPAQGLCLEKVFFDPSFP